MKYNTKKYWVNKEERAGLALAHTKEMEDLYKNEIEDCINETLVYSANRKFIEKRLNDKQIIIVDEIDSVGAIFKYINANEITAVLNFASYKNPGGMFIKGSKAQEECLCHESYLYNILKGCMGYYKINNNNKNKALYTDRALYSPNVRFIRGDKDVFCDVITCAAPNKTAAQKYCNVSDEENSKVLKERIEFVLKIAQDNGVDNLILGAYGCGVFGQDPLEVAKIFKEFLSGKYKCFNKVIFAIPNKLEVNYRCFQRIFK